MGKKPLNERFKNHSIRKSSPFQTKANMAG